MTTLPFSAIVGQELMKLGLLLTAVSPRIGGILIRGHRGTAKTTAVRALAAILPPIEVVDGCRFSCDPDRPVDWCDECRSRGLDPVTPPRRTRAVRMVDLPVSATEDRVVGTLDLERALQQGERAFEAGVLGGVHRGVLYVDEVNLLDDHLVDVLLDAAAQGTNIVEREGITFRHPARFVLVGTMNPEEGELRPQLLDRFGLCIDVETLADVPSRARIVEQSLAWDADPAAFAERWRDEEASLARRLAMARAIAPAITHTPRDVATIAALTAAMGVEGHRADLVTLRAARARAALQGRPAVIREDILAVMPMVLAHRLPQDEMGRPEVERLTHLDEHLAAAAQAADAFAEGIEPQKKK
jgi:Mg-chelatase subunit ChlI